MPQATNLVIKNHTAVDKTFTLLSPAAGKGGIAEWALKEGVSPVAFPRITLEAHKTPNRAQKATGKVVSPAVYTDPVSTVAIKTSQAEFNFNATVPDDFPEAMRDDFVAYATNCVTTALMKSCLRDGLPAT